MTTSAAASDLASGKGHRDENFPVASFLIRKACRAPVLAFYRFARLADDVADHPTAAPADKLARLAALEDTLLGRSDAEPAARALREILAERGLDRRHPLDLLEAFRRDVTKTRYASWDDLIDYCSVSAMPVGRFVLDVHGEDRATWRESDMLCAALQIVNHLQDFGKDYRALDRVYLPQDMMAAAGVDARDLAAPRASPGLRGVIAAMAERTQALLAGARPFARAIADRRLGIEVAVIHALANDLAARLRTRDPLSERVHHGKGEAALIAARATIGRISAR